MTREDSLRGRASLLGSCAAAICSLALASPASAATITPTVLTDDMTVNGNCTLREAIQATNIDADVDLCDHDTLAGEDTINLSEDTPAADEFDLNLPGTGEDDNQTGDLDVEAGTGGLRIVGAGGGASIDGNNVDRILHIQSDSVEIQGVTFNQGLSPAGTPGGAIFTQTSSNASLELTNSVVNSNHAGGAGGGIQLNGSGGATITNSTIDQNTADTGLGGGISGGSGPLTITNSTIADNTVDGTSPLISGGGVAFATAPSDAQALTITNSLIDNNTATGTISVRGGGVQVEGNTATASISSSVVSNNDAVATGLADAGGGGLRFGSSTEVTVTNSVISGNTSVVAAGGAANVGGGVLNLGDTEIQRSTISGNSLTSGTQDGGGIRADLATGNDDALVLVNSTVANNTALGGGGGGLDAAGTTTSVFNTTFSGNDAAAGDALQQSAGSLGLRGSIVDDDADAVNACAGAITSDGFNVTVGTSCVDGAVAGDEQNADPQLGALADNGGPDAGPIGAPQPVQTQLPSLTSDALEQIPAVSCTDEGGVNPLAVDQRGFPRPFDSDNAGGTDCEAGSVEVFQCGNVVATHVGSAAADVINGTAVADVIVGAGGDDIINGGVGADRLCGNEGNDTLDGGDTSAADQYNGGPGSDDEITFENYAGDIIANLTNGTTSDAGGDSIVVDTVENLRGGVGANSFIGDGADNDLRGGAGDDFIAAGGGDDLMDGGAHGANGDFGDYGLAFNFAADPVTASLQNGTATGQGTDTLIGLENLRGGRDDDNLTGDAGANEIRGDMGNDTIIGLGGGDDLRGDSNDDSILARDGVQDDVDCGAGTMDFVEADQQGVDLIDPNCESISFFVPPVIAPPAATPTPTPTATPVATEDPSCDKLRKNLMKARKKGKQKKVKKLRTKLRKKGC